jgi:hypothetical protein
MVTPLVDRPQVLVANLGVRARTDAILREYVRIFQVRASLTCRELPDAFTEPKANQRDGRERLYSGGVVHCLPQVFAALHSASADQPDRH